MTEAKEHNLSQHIMSAKDYIQDGLVFQLDGIENAGYGKHIEGVGVSYIDLKQGWGIHDNYITSIQLGKNSIIVLSTIINGMTYGNLLSLFNAGFFSMEVYAAAIGDPATGNHIIGLYDTSTNAYGWNLAGLWFNQTSATKRTWGVGGKTYTQQISSTGSKTSMSITQDHQTGSCYFAGNRVCTLDGLIDRKPNLGNGYMYANNEIFSFRIYNRPLADDEVAYNHKVDVKRFGI